MAKELGKVVKLQVRGGAANPSPPVGPALGAAGVNIMEFCKQFNARTQDKPGKVLPVVISVYKDKLFWVFFVAMFIFGFTFMQYFSTMPLYYKDARFLSEFEIGLLMGFNGFFIFVF